LGGSLDRDLNNYNDRRRNVNANANWSNASEMTPLFIDNSMNGHIFPYGKIVRPAIQGFYSFFCVYCL